MIGKIQNQFAFFSRKKFPKNFSNSSIKSFGKNCFSAVLTTNFSNIIQN